MADSVRIEEYGFPRWHARKVVEQQSWMHLLLHVKRRSVQGEVRPVLLVLAAPDELRIQVPVALLLLRVASSSFSASTVLLVVFCRGEFG
jgi:hypothetical protein